MPCNPLTNNKNEVVGFVCTGNSYMEAETTYWKAHLDKYKEVFIEYMDRVSNCGIEHAKAECEAHIENVGVDDLETPEYDADECIDAWNE